MLRSAISRLVTVATSNSRSSIGGKYYSNLFQYIFIRITLYYNTSYHYLNYTYKFI